MTIDRVTTGIPGLDEILGGGLPARHAHLLQGEAGTGKTTMAFQFLMAGVERGEKAMYISILQTREEIQEMADSHGWDISNIEMVILTSAADEEARFNEQNLLPSHEIQLDEVMEGIKEAFGRFRPSLVVFDSVEQFRLIAQDPMIYQKRSARLLRLFGSNDSTALFIHTTEEKAGFKTIVHGVISLDSEVPKLGGLRRYLRVEKMRNISFAEGRYSYRIRYGGVDVFPPLSIVAGSDGDRQTELVVSGNGGLDTMLGGGLPRGTACLVSGAAGTGKSTLASVYAYQSAVRGEHAAVFTFDERVETFLERNRGLGMEMAPLIDKGMLSIEEIGIGEITVGELGHRLRRSVEEKNTKVVVLDSVTGFFSAMASESHLFAHLHEILAYLGRHGVLTLLILTEHGVFSDSPAALDISFISDSVILIRRFESMGGIRLAISVVKKRIGGHENFIRELQFTDEGIRLSEPLEKFDAILTGHPRYLGKEDQLMD